jgi:hypothetical protein
MRIFTDGAEMGDVVFWDNPAGSSAGTSSPTPYASAYRYGIASGTWKSFTPLSEFYFRMRVLFGGYGENAEIYFRNSGTNLCLITWNWTTHKIVCYAGGTLLGTGTTTMSTNTWYLVQLYYKIDDTTGSAVVYVDGNKDIEYTGDTKPSTQTTVDNLYMSIYNCSLYFDDLALNDTDNSDGKNDDSWCGDGIVVKLTPSGSSATANNWLNSGSVSGSANYLYVDEYPNDGDTTYVYASASSTGLQTQFSLSDFPKAGTTITRIWAEARVRKTTANDYGVKIGQLASGGTDVVSGSKVLTTGAYTRITGSEVKINPVTSASWTKADLDNLELVLEI